MKIVTGHSYGFPVKGSREPVSLLREKKAVLIFMSPFVTMSCCLITLPWGSPDSQITAIYWLVLFEVPVSEILWITALIFTGSLITH